MSNMISTTASKPYFLPRAFSRRENTALLTSNRSFICSSNFKSYHSSLCIYISAIASQLREKEHAYQRCPLRFKDRRSSRNIIATALGTMMNLFSEMRQNRCHHRGHGMKYLDSTVSTHGQYNQKHIHLLKNSHYRPAFDAISGIGV